MKILNCPYTYPRNKMAKIKTGKSVNCYVLFPDFFVPVQDTADSLTGFKTGISPVSGESIL
jgi:hypothetical protein